MPLYRVTRHYGNINSAVDIVIANNEDEVYKHMRWERKDKPELIIEKITKSSGCIASFTTHRYGCIPIQKPLE